MRSSHRTVCWDIVQAEETSDISRAGHVGKSHVIYIHHNGTEKWFKDFQSLTSPPT